MGRSPKYPNLPTLDEAGVKGYEVNTWVGFFGPAGMPKDVAAKIEAAIKEALASPDVRARFESAGAVVRSGSADALRQILSTDVAKWAKLVRDQNIKLSQ
jgi:tripartite-type tricarboxylate transporter receptor subunit TctC